MALDQAAHHVGLARRAGRRAGLLGRLTAISAIDDRRRARSAARCIASSIRSIFGAEFARAVGHGGLFGMAVQIGQVRVSALAPPVMRGATAEIKENIDSPLLPIPS